MEENCIFCKIVKGEIPSYKIWEDDRYIAVLDAFPNIKGQTLVMPKEHIDSYAFGLKIPEYVTFMKEVKTVCKLLQKRMKVPRVHMVLEGVLVSHLHAKLYPAVGFEKGQSFPEQTPVFFDKYPGYVTSVRGDKASNEELEALRKQIAGDSAN
ncbi:MAG: HIT domain-containing protein [Candidatus Marsarchaeota archaeon]|nr:HIT domain-containing protein [Candidatus Marsarchaeota archaeon]